MIDRALAAVLLERQGSFLMWRLMMPWKPIDPARAERERMRRKAMEAARPKGHNRAYKTARWLRIRAEKLFADPRCEFCDSVAATEVDHINGDAWDHRWENLRSACKPCHSSRTMREQVRGRGQSKPLAQLD